jgi:hypothetical protein
MDTIDSRPPRALAIEEQAFGFQSLGRSQNSQTNVILFHLFQSGPIHILDCLAMFASHAGQPRGAAVLTQRAVIAASAVSAQHQTCGNCGWKDVRAVQGGEVLKPGEPTQGLERTQGPSLWGMRMCAGALFCSRCEATDD